MDPSNDINLLEYLSNSDFLNAVFLWLLSMIRKNKRKESLIVCIEHCMSLYGSHPYLYIAYTWETDCLFDRI